MVGGSTNGQESSRKALENFELNNDCETNFLLREINRCGDREISVCTPFDL